MTQKVLDTQTNSCIVVCGEKINTVNTPANGNADSAIEGMCVPVQGQQNAQLARQLIAAKLNCIVSGDPTCAIVPDYAGCDAACAQGNTSLPDGTDCIGVIDAFNSGEACHVPIVGLCGNGTTDLCTANDLNANGRCEDGTKCKSPSADSDKCQVAKGTQCTVVPTRESACNTGCKTAGCENCSI